MGRETQLFQKNGNGGPAMLQISNCENVILQDIIIRESALWTCFVKNSNNVLVENVKVINPSIHTGDFNTSHFWNDSFDATSCKNYINNHCFAWSNDDCIAIMTKTGESDSISINHFLGHTFASGARIGWNSSGNFKSINFNRCEFAEAPYNAISLHELNDTAFYDRIIFSDCWFGGETSEGWRDEVKKADVFFKVYGPDFGVGFAKANTITFKRC